MISTFCFCCEFLCRAFLQSTLEALKSHEEHRFSTIVLVGSPIHMFPIGMLVGLLFLLPFFTSLIFATTRVVEFLLMDSLLHVRDHALNPFYRMLGQTHVNGWSHVIASQNGGSTDYISPLRLGVLQWNCHLFNY